MSGLWRSATRGFLRWLLRPWLLHAAGLLAIAVLGFHALRWPIGAPTPERRPGWPASGRSAAALVVDRARLAHEAQAPPPFSRRDWSLAWLNTLGQEIGPATLLDMAALDSAALDPSRLDRFGLLVLARGASARLGEADNAAARPGVSAATLAALARWVEQGGALIVELPGPALEDLTGLSFATSGAGAAATAPTPAPAPAASAGDRASGGAKGRPRNDLPDARLWRDLHCAPGFLPARPGLARLPLHTRLRPPATVAADVETLATLENEPFALARARGCGLVLSVCADFGLLLTATQQGLPQEDYTVVNRYPDILSEPLKTADLMPDAAYHDNDVPIADLLERALVQRARAGAGVPVPALWYWPDGAPGVYLMTHDDEARGPKAEWMPADETARGVPSTCYVIATRNLDGGWLGRVAGGGHTVGLHWVRTADYALRKVWPLPKLGPFLREVVLPGQTARLSQALAAGGAGAAEAAPAVRHCRLHFLLWDGHWARTFAQLAAAGYAMDSSYGPDWNCKGYLFGTAYPFHPLDGNGWPYALFELPYEHSELEAGASGAWLDSLAAASRAGDHAAIVSLFHPPFMSFAPSAEAYRLWRELPSRMAEAGHPALSMEQVLRFARAREGAELRLERLPVGPTGATATATPTGLPTPAAAGSAAGAAAATPPVERWRVSWHVPADGAGLWLTLPAALRERQVRLVQHPPMMGTTACVGSVTAAAEGGTALEPGAVPAAIPRAAPLELLFSLGGSTWWGLSVCGEGAIEVEVGR